MRRCREVLVGVVLACTTIRTLPERQAPPSIVPAENENSPDKHHVPYPAAEQNLWINNTFYVAVFGKGGVGRWGLRGGQLLSEEAPIYVLPHLTGATHHTVCHPVSRIMGPIHCVTNPTEQPSDFFLFLTVDWCSLSRTPNEWCVVQEEPEARKLGRNC